MLGKPKMPPIEPAWEAMAEGLNSRGDPYQINGILLPPGEWVELPLQLAERLALFGGVQLRQKGSE